MTKDKPAAQSVYHSRGYCPICEAPAEFDAKFDWFRDHLICTGCGSIPRERALALVLLRHFPDWRRQSIHESSPGHRGLSVKLARSCGNYIPSQFYPDKALGRLINGFRNENLEAQTFSDNSFDIVITQDVMEHVNDPAMVFKEIARTLKPGGMYLFTTPTYKELSKSERRARYLPDGGVEYFAEPEYHGNPIDNSGSLVTFHFGHDLAQLAQEWSEMNVEVVRFCHPHYGILGEFTDVYTVSKTSLV
jgi:hypothetical protein